jgi:hypothetical protein
MGWILGIGYLADRVAYFGMPQFDIIAEKWQETLFGDTYVYA